MINRDKLLDFARAAGFTGVTLDAFTELLDDFELEAWERGVMQAQDQA